MGPLLSSTDPALAKDAVSVKGEKPLAFILCHPRPTCSYPASLLFFSSSLLLFSSVPSVKVGSVSVSKSIQGWWELAGGHGSYQTSAVQEVMLKQYSAGFTSFDTADIYGPSESIVGEVAKSLGAGVNTKLCVFDSSKISKEAVRQRVLKSRELLGKIDVLQFFYSDISKQNYVDVALWLSELQSEGLFGELGVTNFDVKSLKKMCDAGVPVKTNQVQCSALDRRVIQSGQADYCASNGIKLVSFGTVGGGIFSDRYLNRGKPSSSELDTYSMKMYSRTAERFGSWDLVQELLRTMKEISTSVNESGRCPGANISNIAQRYVLQTDPTDGCLLLGSRNDKHITQNTLTHAFKLETGEIDEIQKIVDKRRGPKGDVWDLERGYV